MSILAAFCTSFYSARVLFLVFRGTPRMDTNKINLVNLHSHPSYVAYLAIFILSVFSVFFGFLIKDSLVGPDLGVTPYYLGDSAEIVNLVTRAEFLPV